MYFSLRATRSSLVTAVFYDGDLRREAWERNGRLDGDGLLQKIGGEFAGALRRLAVIAARRLVAIHAVVRVGEQLLVRRAVVREHRRAGAHAEVQALARAHVDLNVGNARLQLAPLGIGRFARAVRED